MHLNSKSDNPKPVRGENTVDTHQGGMTMVVGMPIWTGISWNGSRCGMLDVWITDKVSICLSEWSTVVQTNEKILDWKSSDILKQQPIFLLRDQSENRIQDLTVVSKNVSYYPTFSLNL